MSLARTIIIISLGNSQSRQQLSVQYHSSKDSKKTSVEHYLLKEFLLLYSCSVILLEGLPTRIILFWFLDYLWLCAFWFKNFNYNNNNNNSRWHLLEQSFVNKTVTCPCESQLNVFFELTKTSLCIWLADGSVNDNADNFSVSDKQVNTSLYSFSLVSTLCCLFEVCGHLLQYNVLLTYLIIIITRCRPNGTWHYWSAITCSPGELRCIVECYRWRQTPESKTILAPYTMCRPSSNNDEDGDNNKMKVITSEVVISVNYFSNRHMLLAVCHQTYWSVVD